MINAKAWASETEELIYYGKVQNPKAGKVPLGEMFDDYFIHLEATRRKKATTVRGEKWSRTQIEKGLGKTTFLSEITSSVVSRYRDNRIMKGVGASKIRSEIALISCLFKFAIQERSLPLENPVSGGKIWRPAAPKGKSNFLSIEEINSLLECCRRSKNEQLFSFVLIMLHTGMRPGEASNLRIKNINFDQQSITLFDTKNGKDRHIPLTNPAFKEISLHLSGKKPEDFVFCNNSREPKSYNLRPAARFREAFDKAKKEAGLEWVTRQMLRHTAASHMVMNGVSMRVISEMLGHSTLQMTMRYAHIDDHKLRAAVEKLAKIGADFFTKENADLEG